MSSHGTLLARRPPVTPNTHVFSFFRRRLTKVTQHAKDDDIEAPILWGASVDALTSIRSKKHGRNGTKIGRRFVRELSEIVPDLTTISIPILAHDIQHSPDPQITGLYQRLDFFIRYQTAVDLGRSWTAADDRSDWARIQASQNALKPASELVEKARYAAIMYEDCRCTPVHALDYGRRISPGLLRPEHDNEVGYVHQTYSATDPTPPGERVATRIIITSNYLVTILKKVIDRLEDECMRDGYVIPVGATHSK